MNSSSHAMLQFCSGILILLSCSLVRTFFFSSRRRQTRLQGDWSSDVCSSDLRRRRSRLRSRHRPALRRRGRGPDAPRSEERRVGKGVDLGGRRIIKKKKSKKGRDENSEGDKRKNREGDGGTLYIT